MFLSRTGSFLDILLWLLLSGIWSLGGWLICVNLFHLRARERLFAGISSGLLLFILFSNFLGRIFTLEIAYWLAAIAILIIGLFCTWKNKDKPRFPIKDFLVYQQILGFSLLFILFSLINFGLALFDDYSNLPITSMIAVGNIPPHFYLNPEVPLDYHYGMHIFAASLVRIAGLFPWSALDLTKSLSISLTIILSWLWFRRYFRSEWSWLWTGMLILFADGTRWLLLFLPLSILEKLGSNLSFLGSAMQTGTDLHSLLISPWLIEGDGPILFPFAFISGMSGPLTMAMGGNSAFPKLTIFLLLLLARRQWKPAQGLTFGLLLASLTLISEHHFVIIWFGLLISVSIDAFSRRSISPFLNWIWPLFPSLLLIPFIGSAVSTTAQDALLQLVGQSASGRVGVSEIVLRKPPAFLSGHLGTLSLINPGQLFIALCEMGPILFIAPYIIWLTRDYIHSRKYLLSGMGLMSIVSFLTPIFIQFTERDRDLTRLTGAATTIWLILGIPYLWYALKNGSRIYQLLLGAVYVVVILSGLALFPSQLVAIASPQPSYYIHEPDVLISQEYWDQLEPEAKILDLNFIYRPTVLFGRSTAKAYKTVYIPLPEFISLVENPDPLIISRAGYTHIYLDRKTWRNMNKETRNSFQQQCVKLLSEKQAPNGDFRRLLDIQSCQSQD